MSDSLDPTPDAEQLMFGAIPGEPALGRGPAVDGDYSRHPYHHPAAGWGAAESVAGVLARAGEPIEGFRAIFVMNHADGGFDCPGCAWADDPSGLKLDICENGIKHVTWELQPAKADRDFFAAHTGSELATWSDYDLEAVGRLAEPLLYNPETDKYEPVSWEDAFTLVGETLRALESPHQASFYTSGRLSNEATFLYQLWVREFGTNNLPDCSNMCHEASGRAMTAAIGTGKGTVELYDWENADAIWLMGDNAASNAPRMITWLAEADRRGAQLVHINPLIEAASRRTIVPHEMINMATFHTTKTGTMTVQVRIGGDMALIRGVVKAVLEAAEKDPSVLDREFIEYHTHGFEDYRALVVSTAWADIVEGCGISPPREPGMGTVETIEAMHRGEVKVFIALGGNFALCTPDLSYTAEALRNCELTVQVSTKLNRSHIVHGKRALILPCLGRTDKDRQKSGEQGITVEDSMSMVHISYGMKEPASPHLRSECSILAGMAQATLPNSKTPWQDYIDDYDRIRDTMQRVLEGFEDFNTHARHPHGFRIAQPPRERVFLTASGRAEFSLASLPDDTDPGEGRLLLTTIRSHDQFNTTIYSNDDRYRGLKGLRTVLFMNEDDMKERGLDEFDLIDITSFSRDGTTRTVYGYRAVRYEIPRGCAAGYMPELNVICVSAHSHKADYP